LKLPFNPIIFGLLALHFIGLFGDIFNGDSALYACIAKRMAETHDLFQLDSVVNPNWIDKPHLGFWVWSIFISVFGHHSFVFKLPAFIALLVILRYIYLLTNHYYSRPSAEIACIIFVSSLHVIIATNDVRIDLFVIASIMAGLYHIGQGFENKKKIELLVGSIALGLAIMFKGIFVIFPFVAAYTVHSFKKNQLKNIIGWPLAIGLLCVGLAIGIEIWALTYQFEDYNLPKILGQKVSSPIQYFLWDSQFGRFQSNLGQLQANGDPFFYFHNLLWVFFPWIFWIWIFMIKPRLILKEYLLIGGLSTMFLILSMSKTQLSHHALILLPFLSILLGVKISGLQNPLPRWFQFLLWFIMISIILLFNSIHFYMTECMDVLLLGFSFAALLGMVFFWSKTEESIQRSFGLSIGAAIFIGIYLQLFFYPWIMQFQSGKPFAEKISTKYKSTKIIAFYVNPSNFAFYHSGKIQMANEIDSLDTNTINQSILYVSDYYKGVLDGKSTRYDILEKWTDYRTTVISPEFLNPKTRDRTLENHYLLKIYR
jgi:4-amino-4-deoxy-L-arabinose transferase-like glycosyltransferase